MLDALLGRMQAVTDIGLTSGIAVELHAASSAAYGPRTLLRISNIIAFLLSSALRKCLTQKPLCQVRTWRYTWG